MSYELDTSGLARLRAFVDVSEKVNGIRMECAHHLATCTRGNRLSYTRGMLAAADEIRAFVDERIEEIYENEERNGNDD